MDYCIMWISAFLKPVSQWHEKSTYPHYTIIHFPIRFTKLESIPKKKYDTHEKNHLIILLHRNRLFRPGAVHHRKYLHHQPVRTPLGSLAGRPPADHKGIGHLLRPSVPRPAVYQRRKYVHPEISQYTTAKIFPESPRRPEVR